MPHYFARRKPNANLLTLQYVTLEKNGSIPALWCISATRGVMITDLVQIRTLGEKKREENLRFRRHLKSRDHSDRILRKLAEQVEAEIDCTTCAECCRVATAKVTERDIERLSSSMRLKRAQFLEKYTVQDEEEGTILSRTDAGCTFLEGTTCLVYEDRPDACRRFPHVVRGEGSIASRMWQFADRASYCPIVYNSLEEFKVETKFKG